MTLDPIFLIACATGAGALAVLVARVVGLVRPSSLLETHPTMTIDPAIESDIEKLLSDPAIVAVVADFLGMLEAKAQADTPNTFVRHLEALAFKLIDARLKALVPTVPAPDAGSRPQVTPTATMPV